MKQISDSTEEQSGKEKRSASNILVKAFNIDGAKNYLNAGMKGTLADYELVSIKETKIMDVFLHDRE